jgi:hypothetical protein
MILLPYVHAASGGVSSTLVEAGVAGGLVLAAVVKSGLRRAWRRLAAPKGRHRG